MNIQKYESLTVGRIVRSNFDTAEVFNEVGIDFCCGGDVTLKNACREIGLDFEEIAARIEAIKEESSDSDKNFKDWSPDFLADYIINSHHAFVRKTLPQLGFYTTKIAEVHGEGHRELFEIEKLVSKLNTNMLQHLEKEEADVFPAIRKAVETKKHSDIEQAQDKIQELVAEHEDAGATLAQIKQISNSYSVPADGCETYTACYRLLEKFEKDTHVHIHLENNILFPAILEM